MNSHLALEFSVDMENKTVIIKRKFEAGLPLVWDAFTKSEILDQWWAPKPFLSRTKIMNFEVVDQSLHGTKTSKIITLQGGVNVYWALFDMGRRITVKWENSTKEYFLFTGESYNECKFKFASPKTIKCKWEI